MKTKLLFFVLVSFLCLQNFNAAKLDYEVPLAGNAFITSAPPGAPEVITNNGLGNWISPGAVISTYFKVGNSGTLNLSLKAKVPSGTSTVKITVNGASQNISITGNTYTIYPIGNFTVSAGYVKVDLQGITKTGGYFADVSHFIYSGDASNGTNLFCNDPNYFYWARRGPSCHLSYVLPSNTDVSYYYNEVTIPTGEDKIGSYFMANGFADGYFGIQVNSSTERRILFSVWSPFPTDDPNNIPEDHKIKLNCKGTNVVTGEFGNEGSGGQSYLQYNWQAGVTYKFLLKGEPDGTGKTDYTAWFFAPEVGNWKLIASWKRPYTNTYLKSFYSFVENFLPDYGYQGRGAEFGNQWIRTKQGQWMPLSQAKFTADATYTANQRVDAFGGTNNNKFYLKNGGFFNESLPLYSTLTVSTPTSNPTINFNDLPSCISPLSTSDLKKSNAVKVFPNPAHSFINIKGLNEKYLPYKIFNSEGRIILEGKTRGDNISISQLTKGTYLLSLNNSENYKFIKN